MRVRFSLSRALLSFSLAWAAPSRRPLAPRAHLSIPFLSLFLLPQHKQQQLSSEQLDYHTHSPCI